MNISIIEGRTMGSSTEGLKNETLCRSGKTDGMAIIRALYANFSNEFAKKIPEKRPSPQALYNLRGNATFRD